MFHSEGNSENSWWGWPLGSPNPDPISDQKMSFIIRTWPREIMSSLLRLKHQPKRFLNFAYFSLFLIHLELRRQIRCHERNCSLWIVCIKGFVNRLSQDCHIEY